MRRLGFRQKVLLLAVALVMVIQLVTLFPVLDVIRRSSDEQAKRSVGLAGAVVDEFMTNQKSQLETTTEALALDFGFRAAVGSGDEPTIRSALINQAARAGAEFALLLDLEGRVIAVTTELGSPPSVQLPASGYGTQGTGAAHGVIYSDGLPYQTVTVPLRAPMVIAWVVLAYPIDAALASSIHSLTGLPASFVRVDSGGVEMLASTLPPEDQAEAIADLAAEGFGNVRQARQARYLSELRPFLNDTTGVEVALQLPVSEAMAPYRRVRNLLYLITAVSLLLAISGAFWLASSVTRPVQQIAAAARRMRQGIYTEPLDVASSDELGELAAGFNSMQAAIADRERHIFHIAHHDSLSGLPNRELFVGELREALMKVDELVVVQLSLNRFNRIVSSLGHRSGEEIIRLVAALLRDSIGEDRILGHLNHHEFVLALPGLDIEQACELVMKLVERMREGVTVSGANISLQATAGIAAYPRHAEDASELLRCASIAGNDAQLRYEPTVTYRSGQEANSLRQIRIVGDLPRALENNELELCFQPKIECATREVYGVEALVRWRHPELGLLMPDAFVDAIEQAGCIAHLTRWVLEQAAVQCAEWRRGGLDLSMAVNVSADDLVDEYLPYFILDVAERVGLAPESLTLEVTESAIMHNIQMSHAVVSCVRELGFRVAIDDFGTGQSSLAQLNRLPVDELKIDKSFVMGMDSQRNAAIVKTSVQLAHELGLSVVAEGVESEESLERLRALDCESAQGYFIAKPLPAAQLRDWLERWNAANATDLVSMTGAELHRDTGGQAG